MKFPIIKTIDDVLPSIKGHDEFIVAERPFGTVINYLVALEDSFDDPIRRECRGIIFYPDGRIMSRPYHKFFNLGEKNETRPANLDFGQNPMIMDKLDGSMIRPIILPDGSWKFGTKMGITDVAEQAYNWMYSCNTDLSIRNNYKWFIEDCIHDNYTPIFEWCSRSQRIVLDYPEDQLILTGLRNNITGLYVDIHTRKGNIPTVEIFGKMDLNQIQEMAANDQNREGWVVAWPCGKRVKIKLDWYVTLHKAKEAIYREKYVIDAILNDFLDDLKGKLLDEDRDRVEKFEDEFTNGVGDRMAELIEIFDKIDQKRNIDRETLARYMDENSQIEHALRKEAAREIQTHPKWMQPILFEGLNGKAVHVAFWDNLKKLTRTQTMIDANRHIWGGARYDYNGNVE